MILQKIKKGAIVKAICASLAVMSIATSCNDDSLIEDTSLIPTVQTTSLFTAEVDGLDVSFRNLSLGVTEFFWDFGDGNTSNEELPTHTYDEYGDYTITLTTTSESGETDTNSADISVIRVEFDFEQADNVVTFNNLSQGTVENSWDFGDGNTSDEESPEHEYATTGEFTVTLTGTSESGLVSNVFSTVVNVETIGDGGGVEETPAAQPTFDAVILNGGVETSTDTDIWSINPDNASGFNFWSNGDLEDFVELPANFEGGQHKPSFSGSNPNNGASSIRLQNASRRIYQPIEIERDVDYSISAFVRGVETPVGEVVGTFYILDNPVSNELELEANSLAVVDAMASEVNAWGEVNIDFRATTSFNFDPAVVEDDDMDDVNGLLDSIDQEWVILYFVPNTAISGDVHIDDITIVTGTGSGSVDDGGSDDGGATDSEFGEQFALITDLNPMDDDTGELRLDLNEQIEVGMITVQVSKNISGLRGFVNLSGVGPDNTARENAMIDVQIQDGREYSFTQFGDNATIINPVDVVNDDFVEFRLTWDARGEGQPMVEVFIDDVSLTGSPFPTNAGLSVNPNDADDNNPELVAEGVGVVQFRFGGGDDVDESGAGLSVDNLRIYDSSSGTPILVDSDDFESYDVGNSLSPDPTHSILPGETPIAVDTPYRNNSFQATVTAF